MNDKGLPLFHEPVSFCANTSRRLQHSIDLLTRDQVAENLLQFLWSQKVRMSLDSRKWARVYESHFEEMCTRMLSVPQTKRVRLDAPPPSSGHRLWTGKSL